MLTAQYMAAEDLLQLVKYNPQPAPAEEPSLIPLVSHTSALFEPHIRASAVQAMLPLPPGSLSSLKAKATPSRRAWQRFVAIRMAHADALSMDPLFLPDALAVIDRHYTSLTPHRAGRPSVFAVRNGAHLTLRYLEYAATSLVLRPLNMSFPVDLIEISPESSPGEFIAGRVVLTINEL